MLISAMELAKTADLCMVTRAAQVSHTIGAGRSRRTQVAGFHMAVLEYGEEFSLLSAIKGLFQPKLFCESRRRWRKQIVVLFS